MPNLKELESNPYLTRFIDVHSWYCEKPYLDVGSLRAKLKSDARFTHLADYEDVYESVINGISYAVTPKEDGCTTDVMLRQKGKKDLIIALNEIDALLIASGYKKVRDKILYEEGLNGDKVKITEFEYTTPHVERAVLSYPLETPENFYMTLWVEKFKKSTNKQAQIDVLMRASGLHR